MTKPVAATLCLLSLAACEEAMTTTSEVDTGLPDPAVAACMSAVAQRTGVGIVAPMEISGGLSGKTVSLGVGEERAPWECRVDQSGTVVAVAPAASVAR